MSKIDEFSRALGAMETGLRALAASVDRDRQTREREHRENQRAIAQLTEEARQRHAENSQAVAELSVEVNDQVAGLQRQLATHASAVSTMQPQIAVLQGARTRLIALAGVGIAALFVLGRLVETALSSAWGWLFNHLK